MRFLAAKRGWIAARLEALPKPVPFAEGAIVPVLGRAASHPARGRCRQRRRWRSSTAKSACAAIRCICARRVRDHLVAMARSELARRARRLAPRIGRKVARVDRARYEEPMGQLLGTGEPLLQLAIDPRARAGHRLRRRPRGRASRRDEPRAALLAPGRAACRPAAPRRGRGSSGTAAGCFPTADPRLQVGARNPIVGRRMIHSSSKSAGNAQHRAQQEERRPAEQRGELAAPCRKDRPARPRRARTAAHIASR